MSAHLKLELAAVVSVEDPDKLGRVKVQYVDGLISDWLQVASPFAGPGYGMFALETTTASEGSEPAAPGPSTAPQEGEPAAPEPPSTLALVAFATDDRTYGYVIGFIFRWDSNASPYIIDKEKQQNVWILKTKNGKTVTLDDSPDSPAITISDEKQNLVKIDTSKNEISIVSKGDLSINATGTMTLEAEKVVLKGKQNVTIEANEIDLNAQEEPPGQ